MNSQQPVDRNFDFSQTEAIETWSGDPVWQTGFLLRKVPKHVTGTNEEAVIPIQVFYDAKTGKILDNTLPSSLREVLDGPSPTKFANPDPQEPQPFQWSPEDQQSQPPTQQWGGTSEDNSSQTFKWSN
jgi:hypothetical protein